MFLRYVISKSTHTHDISNYTNLFYYRDKVLHRWVHMISRTPITVNMYEEVSFLRDSNLVQFVTHLLHSLVEFNIVLEASLTKGVHI